METKEKQNKIITINNEDLCIEGTMKVIRMSKIMYLNLESFTVLSKT